MGVVINLPVTGTTKEEFKPAAQGQEAPEFSTPLTEEQLAAQEEIAQARFAVGLDYNS